MDLVQALKCLVVVLLLTEPVWRWLPRLLTQDASELVVWQQRRRVWTVMTVTAFVSPSLWIYLPVALWALRQTLKDEPNPAALFVLLLYAVPNATQEIPAVGVGQIFAMNHQRLLAFGLLLPLIWRERERSRLDLMDTCLLGFLGLALVLYTPYESPTNSIRRLFLMGVDVWLLFALFSRLPASPRGLRGVADAWVMSGALLAVCAVFETLKGWLLFTNINSTWGDENTFAWLLRAGSLRAQVSAGHSLTLGIWMAVAWLFFLYVQRDWSRRWARWAVGAVILGGLVASFARGAWTAAMLGTIVFMLLNPQGLGRGLRYMLQLGLALGAILASPLGEDIVKYLPFVGTVDSGNVEYRQRFFELSVTLIYQNPWFGSPYVESQMESLRQGQGIIDFMNGYLRLALFYGLIGCGLFSAVILVGVRRGLAAWLAWRRTHPDLALLAAALTATMLADALFIATASYDPMTYMLAGLLGSLWRLKQHGLAPLASQVTGPATPARPAHASASTGR